MKNKMRKILFGLRIGCFIVHLFLIFMILENIVRVGFFGYLFLIMEFIYVVNTILELLSKKLKYQKDLFYNAMQIGYFLYITIIWVNLYFNKVVLFHDMLIYLKNNYIILSVLIVFLVLYGRRLIGNDK